MNEQSPLPTGLSIGVIVVFITMVLGVCLLVIFLYNLPVIFPPPGSNPQAVRLATPTPNAAPPRATPTITPIIAGKGTPPAGAASIVPATSSAPSTAAPSPAPTLGSTETPARPLSPAPATGRIIFVSERNGFNSIWTMNADGTGQRLLVPHNGNYYDYAPAVSPDGRRLAFSSNREKAGTDNIYVMSLDGANLTRITDTPNAKNASSSWFPDGNRLAFTSSRSGRWQVYTMNADGSGQKQIISSEQDIINVSVAPNGNTLAYMCGREICLANTDGSNQRVLLQNGLPKDHLAWSPDSSLLAFTQANPGSGKTSVYVLNMQGNNRRIADNGGWPCWSPEGRMVVFSSDMNGVANLYAENMDTGQIQQLTRTQAADYTPIWTR